MVPTWLRKFLNGPASFWDLFSSYFAQSSYLVQDNDTSFLDLVCKVERCHYGFKKRLPYALVLFRGTGREGSAYCYAPLHVRVKNYFQSENFGSQKKMANFSEVFEKVVWFSGGLRKLLDMNTLVLEVKKSAIAAYRNSRKTRKFQNSLWRESGIRVISFGPIHKTITRNFSVTRGIMLGSENSESRVIYICTKQYIGIVSNQPMLLT